MLNDVSTATTKHKRNGFRVLRWQMKWKPGRRKKKVQHRWVSNLQKKRGSPKGPQKKERKKKLTLEMAARPRVRSWKVQGPRFSCTVEKPLATMLKGDDDPSAAPPPSSSAPPPPSPETFSCTRVNTFLLAQITPTIPDPSSNNTRALPFQSRFWNLESRSSPPSAAMTALTDAVANRGEA